MLHVETNCQHPRQATLYLFSQRFFLIRVVSVAEQLGCCQLLRLVLDDMDSAEGYHTTEEGGVLYSIFKFRIRSTSRSEGVEEMWR